MLRRIFSRVASYELLVVVALGPLFIFSSDYTWIGLVLIAGLWLCRWWGTGRFVVRLPVINACMLVLLLTLPVSLWASVALSLSWPLLYRIVWGIALFYAVLNNVHSEARVRLLAYGSLAAVAVLSLIGLVGTDWARTKLLSLPMYRYLPALITDESALPGGAFHPNVIAGTLAPFVPLALSLVIFTGHGRGLVGKRVGLSLLVALLCLTVFLTQSRAGWLSLGIGIPALVLVLNRRLWLGGLLFVFIAAMGVIVLGEAGLRAAFIWLDTTGTGTSRLELWNRALTMVRDMPFTGVGLGTFPVILDAFYPSFLAGPDARIPHAHNLLLQVAVDLGLPGMVAFAILFAASLSLAFRAYRRSKRRSFLCGLSAGVIGALIVVVVHGLFHTSLWAARSAPLLWVLLSLGPVIYSLVATGELASPACGATQAKLQGTWRLLSACLTENWMAVGEDALDWEPIVALAEKLGLSPLLFRVLKQADRDLPTEVGDRLLNAYWVMARRMPLFRKRLAEIARAYDRSGIPLVVLKGFALAVTAYPDVGTRDMSDIDLLIWEGDVDRATASLEDLGYVPVAEHFSDHPEAFVRCFDGERAFRQSDQFGCVVELHWRLVSYEWFRAATRIDDMEAFWQRVQPLTVDGVTVQQLAPEDTLLYLCVHLAVHHGYRGVRLFVDLDRLIRLEPGLDWAVFVERACGFRLRNVVYFALCFAQQLLGTPIPMDVMQRLRPPASVRWTVGQLIGPVRILQGGSAFGPQSERLLHFLLVDRWRDRLRGLARVVFPGREWIAARYSVERPQLVVLYGALHPLRMAWLTMLAFGQLLRQV